MGKEERRRERGRRQINEAFDAKMKLLWSPLLIGLALIATHLLGAKEGENRLEARAEADGLLTGMD